MDVEVNKDREEGYLMGLAAGRSEGRLNREDDQARLREAEEIIRSILSYQHGPLFSQPVEPWDCAARFLRGEPIPDPVSGDDVFESLMDGQEP